MRQKIIYILACVLAMAVTGCSTEDAVESQQVGFIKFAFTSVPADSVVTLTLSTADGSYSHTWPDATAFSDYELYIAGSYKAEAYCGVPGSEGYDCPFYYGDATFEVRNMQRTEVSIDCRLMQAMVAVHTTQAPGAPYKIGDVTLHTSGHAYVCVTPGEQRNAYMMPGSTEVYVSLSDAGGRMVNLVTGFVTNTESGREYTIGIEEDAGGVMTLQCGSQTHTIEINSDIFDTAPPVTTCSGFTPDTVVKLVEGYPSGSPITMHVEADTPLKALMLTINGFDTKAVDYHIDVDLMSEDINRLKGLELELPTPRSADIDFTGLLETYQIDRSVNVSFTLQAIDELGRVSQPVTLNVEIESVEFSLLYKSSALIGEDIATIVLRLNVSKTEPNDFSLRTADGRDLTITDTSWHEATRELTLTFAVPAGTDNVPVKIYYLGVEKLAIDISRAVPDFSLSVDPFATRARISVDTTSPEITATVTRNARVRANGRDVAVTLRDPSKGLLEIAGLDPATRYDLTMWVIEGGYTATRQFTTEKAQPVPGGDFEEVEEKYKYKHLPSGGEYSATQFAIYNQQNFTDVSVFWPKKYWASVNDKTFCRSAARHNTWFMQPSAAIDFSQSAAGSKSIVLRSVGWSLEGCDIPPSVQPSDGFLPYNTNRPATTDVSAGCVFLGSYSFDAATRTEIYNEGVAFASRPSSLDGYYKYLPDVTEVGDNGVIEVELVNDTTTPETMVGSGRYLFATAPDFRSFNVPIQYYVYNTAVTRLRIRIMSSVPGDTGVPVTADMPSASFVGSTLWVDNLTFSY